MTTIIDMSGIALDPGDMGVIWIPGVGVRPADGVDVYLAGMKGCPRPSHKNAATDRVERAPECSLALPPATPTLDLVARVRPLEAHPLHAKPLVDHMTAFSRPYDLIAVGHVPDPMPYMPEPTAAVPLPPSGLLLAVACAVLLIATARHAEKE